MKTHTSKILINNTRDPVVGESDCGGAASRFSK
jgi:hypothetical protein